MSVGKQGSRIRGGRGIAFVGVIATLLVSVFASVALGDPLAKPTDAVAQQHLTAGNRLYRVREFEKAIDEYKAGALKEDAPVFYHNLGQCYRQLERYEDAIWHYERFLQRGKPTGKVEAAVTGFIVQMKSELQKKARSQPPLEVEPQPSPAAATQPGSVSAVRPELIRREDDAERGHDTPVRRKLAIAAGVGGLAVVGLGLGLGLRARSFDNDAADVCPMTSCDRADEANKLIERGKSNATYANVAIAVGGVAVVGAAVLWFTSARTERKRMAIAPQVLSSFAGITAFTTF